MLSRRKQRRLRRFLTIIVTAILVNLTLPTPTRAASAAEVKTPPANLAPLQPIIELPQLPVDLPSLPTVAEKPQPVAKQALVVRTSAYSSTVDQTDGDPFTTASGTHVHTGTVAANCLPIGTKIRIPDHFGDKIFTVEDRMNPRWGCNKIDIWMPSRAEALQWGVPTVRIEIL